MAGVRISWTTKQHIPHQGPGEHPHGPGCGHSWAMHAGQHVDYLVDEHAHHAHEGHWDECDPRDLSRHWHTSP
jgi:hypothetical protein